MSDNVEHLDLGPYDPIDDDLNHARDVLDEQPRDSHANFVIGYVRGFLDAAATETDTQRMQRFIRRARAMLAVHAERLAEAVES